MLYRRLWTMPSKWSFDMPILRKIFSDLNVGQGWADPFGAKNKIAEFTNDFQISGIDAFDFMNQFKDKSLRGVLFDPPYSMEQVKRSYHSIGIKDWQTRYGNNKNGGFPNVKNLIAEKLETNGLVISLGWNSSGMGKKRNFEIVEGYLLAHGGNRYDTIITIERKINE